MRAYYIYSMKTAAALGALFLAVLVGGFYYAEQGTPSSVPTENPVSATSTSTSSGASGYTAADIALHASAASCWTSINGSVYDLTTWVGQHPGGEGAILSLCGTDGTAAFENMHGRDPRAQSMLATFKIGALAS